MLALLASAAAPAADADAARLDALQKQLQQVQAALQQLADENRALREHEREVDRRLAELTAPAAAAVAAGGTAAGRNRTGERVAECLRAAGYAGGGSGGQRHAGWHGAQRARLRVAAVGLRRGVLHRPGERSRQTQFDLARAVFGIGYTFDERTEFNSEYEVEHAVSSADDVGEFEVEQFYVDQQLNDWATVRGGLVPDAVRPPERASRADQLLRHAAQFRRDADHPQHLARGRLRTCTATPPPASAGTSGLTTGIDLADWDFAPEFPPYQHRARAREQRRRAAAGDAPGARARQRALPDAVPGAQLQASPASPSARAISSGEAEPVPPPPGAPQSGHPARDLWEGHARWTPGRWDLIALYAHGAISNTAAVNAANPGSPNPIPVGLLRLLTSRARTRCGNRAITGSVAVRCASNTTTWAPATRARVAGHPERAGAARHAGAVRAVAGRIDDRVWTVGANFYLAPHVVLKTDYQWFEENSSFNRWDLGLGVAF